MPALAAIPPTAVPGAVPAAINTVNEANNKIKFDKEGVPRLPPLLNVASQVSVAVSTVSTTIAGIVIFLGSIDLLINLCNSLPALKNKIIQYQHQSLLLMKPLTDQKLTLSLKLLMVSL